MSQKRTSAREKPYFSHPNTGAQLGMEFALIILSGKRLVNGEGGQIEPEKGRHCMKMKILLGILALLAILGALFAVPVPADLSGTWIGKTTIPNGTQDDMTLVLKKAGATYTGTLVDSLGMIPQDTELNDVKLDKNELTANFTIADGTPIKFKLTVNGDKMNGQWEDPGGSTGVLEFEKKK
jgi:hypothetical protein